MSIHGTSDEGKKSILVVDDSEDMRVLLQQILEEEYELIFAENGNQALAQAKQWHPDLVLMDMSLPGMTGWEAVAQIRQMPEFATMPIIAVTAHVSQADQDRSRSIGCEAHLNKPFDVTEVLEAVANLL